MVKTPVPARYIAAFVLTTDVVFLVSVILLVYHLRVGNWHANEWTISLPLLLTLASLYVVDAYSFDRQVSGMRAPVRTLVAIVFAGLASTVVTYAGGYWGNLFGRGVLPVSLLLFGIMAATTRYLVSYWVQERSRNIRWLVLGAGETAQILWKDFQRSGTEGTLLALAKDETEKTAAEQSGGLHVRGTLADLDGCDLSQYSGVIITLDPPLADDLVKKLMHMRFRGQSVYDLTDFYERFWSKVPVMHLRSGWFVFAYGFDLIQNPLGLRFKRILDILFGVLLAVLLAPLFLLISILVRLSSPGQSIYRQSRVGEGGKIFTLYKFRSMREDAELSGAQWADANDARITGVGRFLRILRLDELPQLLNVIRGDMSFIGPRPERPEFTSMLEKHIPYYDSRYLVKPGITGWAQVLYPYGASVDDAREKLQYDLYYIKHYSLLLDIAIVFKTIRVILLGRGR